MFPTCRLSGLLSSLEKVNDAGGGGGGGGESRSVKHNPAHAAVTSPAGISFSPARIRPSIVGRP